MGHPTRRFWLLPVLLLSLMSLHGAVSGASISLEYGGAGIYPAQASANSERYFRVRLTYNPESEAVTSLRVSQGASGQTVMIPNPGSENGVAVYTVTSSATNRVQIYTIGPFAGRDDFGNDRNGVIGHVGVNDGHTAIPFTITAVVVTSSGATTLSASGSYHTQRDNAHILQWYSGAATGVDPLQVLDAPGPNVDDGTGSNTFRFRVQYKILEGYALNLLPRFGTPNAPPGGIMANFVDFDRGMENPRVVGDRDMDWWIYHPRGDDFTDQVGHDTAWVVPEVALIINGDRSRPRYMQREDPSDSDARAMQGIRYFYELLPTDYLALMDNIFLFPYDPPGSDFRDSFASNMRGRPVSNNYVALQAGGHTYEFIATPDFSPPDRNRAWLQVGQPGEALHNDYMRPIPGSGGQMESTRIMTRFQDEDGSAGGFGYPFNSQDTNRYPEANPVLSAHPYFPTGSITPFVSGGALGPAVPGAAPNPFASEVGAGPNPPQRFTNDDTILPNFVNIRPDTDPQAPFRGGKWTSSQTFTFRINYWQSNNIAPQRIQVMIRKNNRGQSPGAWQGFSMEQVNPAATTYANGVVYQFQATPDQFPGGGGPGDYNYYFVASDGIRTTIFPKRPDRYMIWDDPGDIGVPTGPEGASYYSFRVNRPPTLSNQSVEPAVGRSGDSFRFSVTYTDTDGELLNPTPKGDRPFEASIYLDLFGNPQGRMTVASLQGNDSLVYNTASGTGYAADELVGHKLEIESGAGNGRSYDIVSNTNTVINLAPGTDLAADGVASGDRVRVSNWFQGTMTRPDPLDDDYTNGMAFVFDTASYVVLAAGVHRYYYEFRDDWGSWLFPDDPNVRVEGERVRYPFTGAFEGPEVIGNTPPILTDFRFTPDAMTGPDGTTATPFVFTVTYKDNENNPPTLIRLGIDGTAEEPDIILNMFPENPEDTVYTDGAVYRSPPVRLTAGQHIFRAQASDGSGRFPVTAPGQPFRFSGPLDPENPGQYLDHVDGPLVAPNTPPTLSFKSDDDGTDPDDPPGLEPNVGRRDTTFTYTVIYTDVDRFAGVAGNPAEYVHVYINNVQYDMTKVDPDDHDYTKGVEYTFQITNLTEATPHTYFFVASDGLDRARLPEFGVTPSFFNGPVIDEPPGPPIALLAQDTPNDNGGSIDLTWNRSRDDGGGANDVVEYRIYRTETRGVYGDEPVGVVEATGASSYFYADTTAVTGVPYFYVVRAVDATDESANSNEEGPVVAIDNIPPGAPTGVSVSDPALGGTIDVTWNLSPDDGGGHDDVVEYRIYRSTSATAFAPPEVGVAQAGESAFRDTTTTDGTTYYYMVRAFDGSNESADSNVAGPIVSTDAEPPVVKDLYPPNNSIDQPRDVTISFTVEDNGSGVDQSSLEVIVNGTNVTGDLEFPSVTRQRIEVEYQAPVPFDERQTVSVEVRVSDRGNNPASPVRWRFTVVGPQTFSISGTITDNDGAPQDGVLVKAGALSATTNNVGVYTITGLLEGTYNVVPTKRGLSFSPASQSVTLGPNASGIDFIAAPGYDISGTVVDTSNKPMQGVTISDGIRNTVSNANGEWSFRDLPEGTYSLSAAFSGYVFQPALLTLSIGPGQDGTGKQFVGSLQTFDISGVVTNVSGNRISGVAISAVKDGQTVNATTDASGQYRLRNLLPGTWKLTPALAGHEFKPEEKSIDLADNASDVDFVAVPVYALPLGAGLHFVALPIEPDDANPLNAFGAAANVWRWNPDASPPQYARAVQGTLPAVMQLRPNRGFWVQLPADTTARVAGTPVTSDRAMTLSLADGWNMVGNPYDAGLPWANVSVAPGGPVGDFAFIYNSQSRSYELVTDIPGVGVRNTIPVNAGMWMRSNGSRTINVSPASTTAEARSAEWVRSEGEFIIPIIAAAGGVTDSSARAGVLKNAQSNPAAYLIDNPPVVGGSFVDVYFTAGNGRRLACDIRPQAAGDQQYDFVVHTDMVNTPVTISLPDLSQVPADRTVMLVDMDTGKRTYARTMNAYSYDSGQGGPRNFRLEITPAATGGMTISAAAAQDRSGNVQLSYTLSRAADVDIAVMNISGRHISTVSARATNTAGMNTVLWNKRSDTGTAVPTGRYLVRITATAEDGQQASAVVPLSVQR